MDEQERLMFEGWAKLPQFKKKVEQAKKIISDVINLAPCYVSCSWGKDSTVLLHLCQQEKPDILSVFHDGYWMDVYDNFTEIQRRYCKQFPTNLITIGDDSDPFDFLNKSTTKSAINNIVGDCYRVALLGLRAEESKNRRRTIIKNGVIYQYKEGNYRACPLAFWGWKDVWAYTVTNNLPYLQSYDLSPKEGHENRTTPHIKPVRGNSALAEKVRSRLEYQNPKFRELRQLYGDI